MTWVDVALAAVCVLGILVAAAIVIAVALNLTWYWQQKELEEFSELVRRSKK